MTHGIVTRPLTQTDLPDVARILDETGLFPSELLADMAEPFLSGTADHLWLVAIEPGHLLGFTYSEPERMTDGTHNLLAIAVSPGRQNSGIGKILVKAVEDHHRSGGGRVLLVETSSLDDYAGTRAFYDGQGFAREACIREFYAAGEDKIVFWKKL